MNSNIIKAVLMRYYRFQKYYICGTEVRTCRGIGDVVAVSKNMKKSVEVEVKISISDLKADFVNKERKHSRLEDENYDWLKPNYFYFCIPESILDRSVPIIEETGWHKYGIMVVSDLHELSIVKNAQRLNSLSNEKLYQVITNRATSELTKFYIDMYTPEKSDRPKKKDVITTVPQGVNPFLSGFCDACGNITNYNTPTCDKCGVTRLRG